MSRKILALAIALVFGLFVSLLVYGQLNRYRTELSRVRNDLKSVLVVTHDLEIHTELGPDDLKLVSIPGKSLPHGKMPTREEVLGKTTLMPMTAGDIVTSTKLAMEPDKLTMAFQLPKGTLAMAVPINEVVAAGGFVHPGDLVDLIHVTPKGTNRSMVSRLLLSRIKLLALGTEQEKTGQTPSRAKKVLPPTALLQVTPREAAMVAWAQSQGAFWLALRPALDEDPSPEVSYKGHQIDQARTVSVVRTTKSDHSGPSLSKMEKPWSIEMILPGQLQEIRVSIN